MPHRPWVSVITSQVKQIFGDKQNHMAVNDNRSELTITVDGFEWKINNSMAENEVNSIMDELKYFAKKGKLKTQEPLKVGNTVELIYDSSCCHDTAYITILDLYLDSYSNIIICGILRNALHGHYTEPFTINPGKNWFILTSTRGDAIPTINKHDMPSNEDKFPFVMAKSAYAHMIKAKTAYEAGQPVFVSTGNGHKADKVTGNYCLWRTDCTYIVNGHILSNYNTDSKFSESGYLYPGKFVTKGDKIRFHFANTAAELWCTVTGGFGHDDVGFPVFSARIDQDTLFAESGSNNCFYKGDVIDFVYNNGFFINECSPTVCDVAGDTLSLELRAAALEEDEEPDTSNLPKWVQYWVYLSEQAPSQDDLCSSFYWYASFNSKKKWAKKYLKVYESKTTKEIVLKFAKYVNKKFPLEVTV